MHAIYKYKLSVPSFHQSIEMPAEAKVLSVQYQDVGGCQDLMLWAEVPLHAPTVSRYFDIYGTGETFNPNNLAYIATVQSPHGFVWHVYEVQ